jgi:hypothetical protein
VIWHPKSEWDGNDDPLHLSGFELLETSVIEAPIRAELLSGRVKRSNEARDFLSSKATPGVYAVQNVEDQCSIWVSGERRRLTSHVRGNYRGRAGSEPNVPPRPPVRADVTLRDAATLSFLQIGRECCGVVGGQVDISGRSEYYVA